MDEFKVQVNVADVPMMKLLRALARGGFSLQGDSAGQLNIVEVKPTTAPTPLVACDLLPGVMTGMALHSDRAGA